MRLVGSGRAARGGQARRVPGLRRGRRRRAGARGDDRVVAGRVGLVCVLAAWFYTGGSKPYGYLGLGEVMVFVFFGLVAVVGTTYVQTEALVVAGAGRRRRHRRAGLRDPGGQQPARHPHRHRGRQADPRRAARRPRAPGALRRPRRRRGRRRRARRRRSRRGGPWSGSASCGRAARRRAPCSAVPRGRDLVPGAAGDRHWPSWPGPCSVGRRAACSERPQTVDSATRPSSVLLGAHRPRTRGRASRRLGALLDAGGRSRSRGAAQHEVGPDPAQHERDQERQPRARPRRDDQQTPTTIAQVARNSTEAQPV